MFTISQIRHNIHTNVTQNLLIKALQQKGEQQAEHTQLGQEGILREGELCHRKREYGQTEGQTRWKKQENNEILAHSYAQASEGGHQIIAR